MQHYYYRPNRHRKSKSSGVDLSRWKGMFKPFLVLILLILFGFCLNGIYNFFAGSSDSKLLTFLEVKSFDGEVYVKSSLEADFSPITLETVVNPGAIVQVRSDGSLDLLTPSRAELTLKPQTELEYLGTEVLEVPIDKFKLNSGTLDIDTASSTLNQLSFDLNYVSVVASKMLSTIKSGLPIEVAIENGDALVNVLDLETKSTYDSVLVSSDSKLTLDNKAYQQFLRLETPRVLSDYSPVANQVSKSDDISLESTPLAVSLNSPVKITEPLNASVETEERVIIRGTVPTNTDKVMVTSFDAGVPVPYLLKEFKPGSGSFIYYASYDGSNGNIVLGKNIFEVKAIDDLGNESLPARVEFIYKDKSALQQTSSSVDGAKVDFPHKSSKLETDLGLTLPKVVSINDTPYINGFVLN